MSSNNFYPALSTLIPVEDIPDNLGFVKDGISSVFNHLYYKDLQVIKSVNGDAAFYDLTLLSHKRLALEVPGTNGLALVLNPDYDGSNASGFPISLNYKWSILKYVKGFDLKTFDWTPRSFFDLLVRIAGADNADLLYQTIFSFIDAADPILQFVTKTNERPLAVDLVVNNALTTDSAKVADLLVQMTSNGNAIDVLQVIFEDYIVMADQFGDAFSKMESLFNQWLGAFTMDNIKSLLVPQTSASLNSIKLALEVPRSILIPVDASGNPLPEPALSNLTFNVGSLAYSTSSGLQFSGENGLTFTRSQIGKTGIILDFQNMKLDLSRKKNIPEATADGRPDDFVGVFVETATVSLPKSWGQKSAGSTATIKGKNLIIGTGGLSGIIGMEANAGETGVPLIAANFGDKFEVSLLNFDLTFRQNAIVSSNINGRLKIPGFKDATGADAIVDINVAVAQDGDFKVTASEADGILLKLPGVLELTVKSLAIGKQDGKFFLETSGAIKFDSGAAGQFLKDPVNIEKLRIWQDGSIDVQGGTLPLPKTVSLKLGPANITVTAIHFGSHEQVYEGKQRKFRYFGFDGGVSVKPGGVDARGDGIKFYFTCDNNSSLGLDPKWFFRIQGIAVDIIIPGSASKENAAVLINGYLAIKEGATGTEYIGGVSLALPKVKIAGSAEMRMNPKVPAFLVDVGIELSTPLPLGTTGLGIYGFRGLLGQKYVASKSKAGLTEQASWYQYYKAKVSPDFKEGIKVSKFNQKNGFSLGAGVSLATASDSGKVFSSKLFILLSLPDVLLFQGQASILKERIGLDSTQDPPFSAMIAITSKSVEAGFGVNYKVPEDSGAILDLNALIEMGFFFGNAGAWYINVGRDLPEEKRVRARVLSLFNAYSYLMLSSAGISAGAGIRYELNKKFGPVGVELLAYLDMSGRISFKPVQVGGSVELGGSVKLRVFRFKFGFSVAASLAAEAPKPFIVTGGLKVCVDLPRPFKKKCAEIELTWTFNRDLETRPNEILNPVNGMTAVNMMSYDSYAITGEQGTASLPALFNSNAPVIPLDSFIDIEFLKGVQLHNDASSKYILNSTGSDFVDVIPPRRGKSEQVWHQYNIRDIKIYMRNSADNGWVLYQPYHALTQMPQQPGIYPPDINNMKYGSWQAMQPGRTNKLRILASNPLSYMQQGGTVNPDDQNFLGGFLTCQGKLKPYIYARPQDVNARFEAGKKIIHNGILFRMLNSEGVVETITNAYGLSRGLKIQPGSSLEIFLPKSAASVNLKLHSSASGVMVSCFRRVRDGEINRVPKYKYENVSSNPAVTDFIEGYKTTKPLDLTFRDGSGNIIEIDKIVITGTGSCSNGDYLAQESADTDLITQEDLSLITIEQQGKQCDNYVFEVGYIDTISFAFNQTIPAQPAINAQNEAMAEAISKYVTPIWRPDTKYLVRIHTHDDVKPSPSEESNKYYNFYFRTAGPVGHYHESDVKYTKLKTNGAEDAYKLSGLKYYIDYAKSYPNADGNLINSKPLFWFDPVLNLHYRQSYIYTMFNRFEAYNGNGPFNSDIEILIKDPAEAAPENGTGVVVTPSSKTWKRNEFPVLSADIQMLNNHFQIGAANCSQSVAVQPVSVHTEISPLQLQPQKLYTAIVQSKYKGVSKEVHRYVFQTSKFGSFAEQINSYKLKDQDGDFVRNAVFEIIHPVDLAELSKIPSLYNNTFSEDNLIAEYADPFERLISGIFRMNTIAPPVTTEFNFIRSNAGTKNGKIVGVLIRNPEPFNDPRIPENLIRSTIEMKRNGTRISDYILFSKDKSSAFLTNSAFDIAQGDLSFTFSYLNYNGRNYVQAASVDALINLV